MKYSNIDGIELEQFNEIMVELYYYDNIVRYMDELDEEYDSPHKAIRAALYGERFGYSQDSFNPNDDYFTFNGYANLVSIPEYCLQEYFDQFREEILEHVNDNGVELYGVEEEEEEEEEN